MRRLMIGLVALGLVGCVQSLDNLRNKNPEYVTDSAKAPADVSECILHGWQNVGTFSIAIQPNNGGYTVYLNDQWAMTDILKAQTGSRIMYHPDGMLSGYLSKQFVQKIKNCI